ncbi:acetyltransferase [Devosia riboflavina]|uniref:Acetyltransferase n=1 Tax=Devosia riboflavina TaxID=46914 RepID=A0A087LZM3_9HYPH|nr:GNAT family N-acetyltransferase [Devosia riboflavina]KFL30076.1 acetyltransferase [Devosia riboflavina]
MVGIAIDPHPSDAVLRELWLSAWGDAGPASWQPILQRSLAHVGAYEDEKLVGFVNIAWDGGVHAFILDTCTHRDFRLQGIATKLVKAAENVARERGAKWLHVDFEPHLLGFYRGCGFRPTEAGLIAL